MYTLYQNDLPSDLIINGDLAIDTETMGLNLIRDRLCLIQLSNGDGTAILVQFDGSNYSAPNLKKLLLEPQRNKIFHFARFDLAAIQHYLGIQLGNVFCTKIASKLTRTYTDYHGLKELCRELISISVSKQQQTSNWGAKNLSEEQLEYASKDVLYLHQLRDTLICMLKDTKRLDTAIKLFECLPTIASLDLLGWNGIEIFSH